MSPLQKFQKTVEILASKPATVSAPKNMPQLSDPVWSSDSVSTILGDVTVEIYYHWSSNTWEMSEGSAELAVEIQEVHHKGEDIITALEAAGIDWTLIKEEIAEQEAI